MGSVICKIITGTTPDQVYLNVKRIVAELNNGTVEIYSDHQNLLGTIEIGKLEIEDFYDGDQRKIVTYLLQNGAIIVKKEDSTTFIEIYAEAGLEFTEDITFDIAKQQYDGRKKELASILKLVEPQDEIEKIDFGPMDRVMEVNFHRLQKEVFFWDRVMEILEEKQ